MHTNRVQGTRSKGPGCRVALVLLVVLLLAAGCGEMPTAAPPGQWPATPPTEGAYPLPPAVVNPTCAGRAPTHLPLVTVPPGQPTPSVTPTPPCHWEPEPTSPTATPTPTSVLPTPWPSPAVTPIPVAGPPYIPGLSRTLEPFQVFFVKDDALWVLDSRDGQARLLLDAKAAFSMVLQQRWRPVSASPDGQWLAVALTEPEAPAKGVPPRTAIYVYDRTAGTTSLLVEGAMDPRWAPDGRRIAYQKEASLWITDLTTGGAWRVFTATAEAVRAAGAPIIVLGWSPNGERVGFLYFPNGWGNPPEALMAKASGGGETTHLLGEPADTSGPVWSPDGSRVLYVIADLDFSACMGPAHCSSLWVANADGSGASQLLLPSFDIGAPQWSPDGQWILFSGVPVFERPRPLISLWLIKADGTSLLRLTDPYPTGNDLDPMWTPDGTRVIFRREGQGIWALNLIDGSLDQLYLDPVDFLVAR